MCGRDVFTDRSWEIVFELCRISGKTETVGSCCGDVAVDQSREDDQRERFHEIWAVMDHKSEGA